MNGDLEKGGEGLEDQGQQQMTPEQAREVFLAGYKPEGQERAEKLDLSGLRGEREWLQGGLDDCQRRLDAGEEKGIMNGEIKNYGEVIPRLTEQIKALDVLIQDAEAKEK